jgi:hypothetical protein
MKDKPIRRVNPRDRSQKKPYAVPVNNGTITEDDLQKEICLGDSVTLPISLNSEGVENSADFNVGMIDSMKRFFMPSAELKQQLAVIFR